MDAPDPATALLRLATGHEAAQTVIVAARLGLADLLADGPRDAAGLAAATGAHASSLHRLLRALAALDVVREQADGRFGLGPLGAPLRDGVAGSLRALVLLFGHDEFWQSWGDLEHSVRTGETAVRHLWGVETSFDRYAAEPALGHVFNAGMTALSGRVIAAVLGVWRFPASGLIVDVGGGEGALLAAVLRANPGLRGVVFDLPPVAEAAAAALAGQGGAGQGLGDRAEAVGGDMFAAVPPGGDIYMLKSVLHDWADGPAGAVLRAVRAAMAPTARLLVIERLMPDRMGPEARMVALADLRMLLRTGGRERTKAEFRVLFDAAGLRWLRTVPTATGFCILELEGA
jgi:hypothetical protein